jgi:hypothetical protein
MQPIKQKKETDRPGRPEIAALTLAEWLKENRVTNKEFIVKMGISDAYGRNLAKGKLKPSLEMAIAIEDMTLQPVAPSKETYSYVSVRSWFWKN